MGLIYQFGSNNFNGTGNFGTAGWINGSTVYSGGYNLTIPYQFVTNGTFASWANVMNGTVLLASQWNATNTSYYLASNPNGYYNSTTLPASGAGNINGSGTAWYIPMWNGTTSLNNSRIYQNGNYIGIGATTAANTTLYILGNLTVSDALGTIYIGNTGNYLQFNPNGGTHGRFVFSAPLLVPASSPGITFYDPNQPNNASRQQSINYSADTGQLTVGDTFTTSFGNGSGQPLTNSTFFLVGTLPLVAPQDFPQFFAGTYIGANTPSNFYGSLLNLEVANVSRFLVTNYGDLIIRSGTMTNNAPSLNIKQTWNNSNVAFTSIFLDMNDTGSLNSSNLIDLEVNDTSRFVVQKYGATGIGTANPQNMLNVIGDINATGSVYANGKNLSALTGSSGINGSGTAWYIPMWNSTNSLNNSAIYQNGNEI